ncbi:hypothetical protein DJ568_13870 [Mucilaginibacter hurinus]|uniref:Exo-alpha-sialidase n=1 Tax=Mucilaginibacter hurinus TaxID=2201324 RepID=A0A367GLM6_9SPHI|nr:hypothetical protein DJ568_13870 [Mucilaginibacter hurinus]
MFFYSCSKSKLDNPVEFIRNCDFPANDAFFLRRLADGPGDTNVWVQGKMCADKFGRLYMGYISGDGHHARDRTAYTCYSDDNGKTWSPLKVIKPNIGGSRNYGITCQALGVDDDRKLWAIVRNHGNNFLIGHTFHEIWSSADFGSTWEFHDRIDEITSGPDIIGGFHDMIQVGNNMIAAYHSNKGSKLGFIAIDRNDPTKRVHTDVIADGGPHDYVEATMCYDAVNNKIIGGLRSELTVPQLFFMNTDFSGFQKFNSACHILRTPVPVKIMGHKIVYMGIERKLTGEVAFYVGNLDDLYRKSNNSTCKATIGFIVNNPIPIPPNVGVPDMEVVGQKLHFGFSQQRDNGHSSVYYGNVDSLKLGIKNPLTYNMLVDMQP